MLQGMEHSDVIVIGSGLGGLASGVLLAKRGMKVLVLEQSAVPGGCLQSYQRRGLWYDTGVHYIGGLGEGHSLHSQFEELGLADLPWVRMDECFDHVVIGGSEYCIAQGFDNFVDVLAQQFPTERESLKAFVSRMQNISPDDMDVNAWQYMHETFADVRLIDAICGPMMRIELRKDTLPLFSMLHALRGYIESSWRLKGHGNMIVDRLTAQIKNAGGAVRCNSKVVGLQTEGELIKKVVTEDGSEFEAQYVVSDIHPATLCTMLQTMASDSLPPKRIKPFVRRMTSAANTMGVFTASLELKDGTVPYRNHNIYIYNTPDVWTMPERGDGLMVSFRVPEDDSEYARQLDLLTPMTWDECRQWSETSVGRRGDDYRRLMDAKTKRCIELAEQCLPGLADCVKHVYTSSPLTYRDYLGAPEGTAFGIRKDNNCSMLTYNSINTPLTNLFLTGQNIMLTGIKGVTYTAFDTARRITG